MLLDELLERVDIAGIAATLVTDLTELACAFGGLHHGACAINGVRHHLLTVDMASRLKGHHRVRGVPEVRTRHNNGVQLRLLRQHVFGINVALGDIIQLEGGFHTTGGATDAVFHDVADGGVAEPRDVLHGIEENFMLLSATNEADPDLVRWCVLCFRAQNGRGPQDQAGAYRRAALQKIAS